MLSQAAMIFTLALASLASAGQIDRRVTKVRYDEATAYDGPASDGQCTGSALGTAKASDAHHRIGSSMWVANYGSQCVATKGAKCWQLGGRRGYNPDMSCDLFLYKGDDECYGSEANKYKGKIQKPSKKIPMHGSKNAIEVVGDFEFDSMLIDCTVDNSDRMSF